MGLQILEIPQVVVNGSGVHAGESVITASMTSFASIWDKGVFPEGFQASEPGESQDEDLEN